METMRSRIANPPTATTRQTLATLLIFLAAATQFGCGREFFREWANQDVSEVIFEKSRDPRFRIDMFSIDPPPLRLTTSSPSPCRPSRSGLTTA
jgi:hypothetical protein